MLAEAALTGIMGEMIYAPYDITGKDKKKYPLIQGAQENCLHLRFLRVDILFPGDLCFVNCDANIVSYYNGRAIW